MHNPLCNLPSGNDLHDSNRNETSNDSRSSVTSDSVLKPTVSVSQTLSTTSGGSGGFCKPLASSVGSDQPPQLPFRHLFFAHLGWGFQFSPSLRSVINGAQPYLIVPHSHCFWQPLTPCVYESSSEVGFDFLTVIPLPYADDCFHKLTHHRQRIGGLANPIYMGGCCIYVDANSWSTAVWEVF